MDDRTSMIRIGTDRLTKDASSSEVMDLSLGLGDDVENDEEQKGEQTPPQPQLAMAGLEVGEILEVLTKAVVGDAAGLLFC